MYKVTAEFESVDGAELASGRLRGYVQGLQNIRTVPKIKNLNGVGVVDVSAAPAAYADGMLSPATIYQAGAWSVMMSGYERSDGQAERIYEPAASNRCVLIAEGSRDSAERAAAILRAIGGTDVHVSGGKRG